MPVAGYSETPLLKKLGIKTEMKVLVLFAPKNYFQLLQKDITSQYVSEKEAPELVHLFAKDEKTFKKEMKKIL